MGFPVYPNEERNDPHEQNYKRTVEAQIIPEELKWCVYKQKTCLIRTKSTALACRVYVNMYVKIIDKQK